MLAWLTGHSGPAFHIPLTRRHPSGNTYRCSGLSGSWGFNAYSHNSVQARPSTLAQKHHHVNPCTSVCALGCGVCTGMAMGTSLVESAPSVVSSTDEECKGSTEDEDAPLPSTACVCGGNCTALAGLSFFQRSLVKTTRLPCRTSASTSGVSARNMAPSVLPAVQQGVSWRYMCEWMFVGHRLSWATLTPNCCG